jgi:hypothetical protein
MLRLYSHHVDGYIHEQEILPRSEPVYPFGEAQTPDLYPRLYNRRYHVQRGKFTPKIATRNSWTNLLTYSSSPANAAHTKNNLTATDNVAAHPRDGLTTLGTLMETVTNGAHTIGRAHTFTVATLHTLSLIAKFDGRDWLRLHINDGTDDQEAWFNLSTGATRYFADAIPAATLNGGFETAGGGGADVFSGWTEVIAGGTSTITRDTADFRSGTAACRFNIDASGNYGAVAQTTLVVGRRYRLAFWAKNGGSGGCFATNFGGGLSYQPALTAVWTQYEVEFTAGVAEFYLGAQDPSTTVWLDDVSVTRLTPSAVITPAARNGGFETAGGGGADVFGSWAEVISGGTSTITRDTAMFRSGVAACRFNIDAGGNYAAVSQAAAAVGRRYRLGFWAKNGGTGGCFATNFGGGLSYQPVLTTSWELYEVEFIAGNADVFIGAQDASSAVWIDDVILTPIDLPTVSMQLLPFPAEGCYRCSITFMPRAAAGTIAAELSSDGNLLSYAGNTALGIYAASMELKAAATAGPVVETLGSSRTVLSPDVDPDDPFALLVAESKPEPTGIGDLCRVDRTFARPPATQLLRDYQSFARPNPSGLKSGSVYCASLDDGASFLLWNSSALKLVYGYTTTQGTSMSSALPSGTVTITLSESSTASFAANASAATITTACASIIGATKLSYVNVFKAADGSAVTIHYGRYYLGATVTSVSLPSGVVNNGVGNSIQLQAFGTTVTPDTKLLHVPSHGKGVGAKCALYSGTTYLARGSVASVSDGNYINLVISDLSSPDLAITHLAFDEDATVRYAAGAADINVRIATEYFLPGVTMLADGSTFASLDDLPAVAVYPSEQRWLDRLVAGDTYTAISASKLETYLGAIQSRSVVYAKKDAICLESLSLT